MKGYIQVYTGNGKGKTTAAFGLALRAAGAGKRTFFGQLIKSKAYSEIEAVAKYLPDSITTRQYGHGCFIGKSPEQADIDAAKNGLKDIKILFFRENTTLLLSTKQTLRYTSTSLMWKI